jgi:hypothetical protein
MVCFRSSVVFFFYRPAETIATGTGNQERFSGLWPLSCNLLFETIGFGLGIILLSYLVSELQKLPSPGLKCRTLSEALTFLKSVFGIKA